MAGIEDDVGLEAKHLAFGDENMLHEAVPADGEVQDLVPGVRSSGVLPVQAFLDERLVRLLPSDAHAHGDRAAEQGDPVHARWLRERVRLVAHPPLVRPQQAAFEH